MGRSGLASLAGGKPPYVARLCTLLSQSGSMGKKTCRTTGRANSRKSRPGYCASRRMAMYRRAGLRMGYALQHELRGVLLTLSIALRTEVTPGSV
jgi:hypothetical protein